MWDKTALTEDAARQAGAAVTELLKLEPLPEPPRGPLPDGHDEQMEYMRKSTATQSAERHNAKRINAATKLLRSALCLLGRN